MFQGLKRRRTRVLEGSRMAVGGGGAGLWELGKTTIRQGKVRFYLNFNYFPGRRVGAGP